MSRSAEVERHRLSAFGLEMLAHGAAGLRADRQAIAEYGPGACRRPIAYRDLKTATIRFAALAIENGLRAGDCALVLGVNRMQTAVALIGLLAAGVEPIVAPAYLDVAQLAQAARLTNARALFGALDYGDWDCRWLLGETARAIGLSWVGALDESKKGREGVVAWRDFSLSGLGEAGGRPDRFSAQKTVRVEHQSANLRIGLARLDAYGAANVSFYAQAELVAEALGLVSRLCVRGEAPIVTTISPASKGGLAAGLVAALLSGAPLHVLGPFDGAALVELLAKVGRCYLVAPAGAIPDFLASGVLKSDRILGLALTGEADAGLSDPPFKVVWLDSGD